jgi:S1-C subfamily serine protease
MKKPGPHCLLALVMFCGVVVAQDQPDVLKSAVRLRLQQFTTDEIVTGWGSAVAIDLKDYGIARPRYLLSAAHLVLSKTSRQLATGELKAELERNGHKDWVSIKVVAVDDKADLCLLETPVDLPIMAKLGDGKEAVGDELMIVGCPSGVVPQISRGRLTSKTPNVEGKLWQAAAKFWHGNSGGPVFNARTCTITGVAVAGVKSDTGNDMDPNTALFCPMDSVKRFLGVFARMNSDK